MTLENAKIYNDGVKLGYDCEEKIRQIINTLEDVSPSFEVSFRFLKSGKTFEGLLWGKTSNIPIGAYNRGPSMHHVLDMLHKRVQRECFKIVKTRGGYIHPEGKAQSHVQPELAMAG